MFCKLFAVNLRLQGVVGLAAGNKKYFPSKSLRFLTCTSENEEPEDTTKGLDSKPLDHQSELEAYDLSPPEHYKTNKRFHQVTLNNDLIGLFYSQMHSGKLDEAYASLVIVQQDFQKKLTRMYSKLANVRALKYCPYESLAICYTMKQLNLHIDQRLIRNVALSIFHNKKENKEWVQGLTQLYNDEKSCQITEVQQDLLKVYGRYGMPNEAWKIFNEIRDKAPLNLSIFLDLFEAIKYVHVGILKEFLLIWQIMKSYDIKPNQKVCQKLLNYMKRGDFGDLKVNDTLTLGRDRFQIKLVNTGTSNLLAAPPVVSRQTLMQFKLNEGSDFCSNDEFEDIAQGRSELFVNDIFRQDKLILFGGLSNILDMMELNLVEMNSADFLNLILVCPSSEIIEDAIVELAKEKGVSLCRAFYNQLMKRRVLRFQYKSAKEVLETMKKRDITPNVETWNLIAMGCLTNEEIEGLFSDMKLTNCKPDAFTIATLIKNQCMVIRSAPMSFKFVMIQSLLHYLEKNNLVPKLKTYRDLEEFTKLVKNMKKDERLMPAHYWLGYEEFMKFYEEWSKKTWKVLEARNMTDKVTNTG